MFLRQAGATKKQNGIDGGQRKETRSSQTTSNGFLRIVLSSIQKEQVVHETKPVQLDAVALTSICSEAEEERSKIQRTSSLPILISSLDLVHTKS